MGLVVNVFEFNDQCPDKNEVVDLMSKLSGLPITINDISENMYQVAFLAYKNEKITIENKNKLKKSCEMKHYLSISYDISYDATLLDAALYTIISLGGYNSKIHDISGYDKKFPVSLAKLKYYKISGTVVFYTVFFIAFLMTPFYMVFSGVKKILRYKK